VLAEGLVAKQQASHVLGTTVLHDEKTSLIRFEDRRPHLFQGADFAPQRFAGIIAFSDPYRRPVAYASMKNQPTIAQLHHLTSVFPEVNLENSAAGTVCSATVNRNLWFENRSVARCCARVAVMRALNIAARIPSAVA
jgi:hypothetical protein